MAAKIEKRGENSYRLNVSAGSDGNGKQIVHRKTVTASGPQEAKRLYNEFATDVQRGLVIEHKNLTFKAFVDIWLRDHAEKQLAPKTIYRYKQILNGRVIPALGLSQAFVRITKRIAAYQSAQSSIITG
jgi:integrase